MSVTTERASQTVGYATDITIAHLVKMNTTVVSKRVDILRNVIDKTVKIVEVRKSRFIFLL